ncbi:M48 family metalloprotease [Natronolimnohabitans sp. A-GB9]|uniref:M48 family metallopeptidase n=1 Tax=Natronolimnohabitans sp. A-GB9 TaxID=3069757 RepID=UPI0027B03C6E|nr:M48 family metalloprotease [Natronolimnohabitans sp. A-GB9]MDQ2049924.1 M48 family metalloprotease [Natronolimnohabitans sp. A-GB9]
MRNTQLKLRMAIVGVILFALYFGAALVFDAMFPGIGLLPILALSIIVLPAAQYKLGKWMALRGTEEMPNEGQYRQVHEMTESLSRDMGLDKPKLVVQDMGVPNAFATGRKGAGVVCVSNELIQLLERDELEGVIAHELAHLNNRDTITMILGQSVGMVVSYATFFLVRESGEGAGNFIVAYAASIVAQMLTMIFVMAISRYREYVADDDARQYIGSGDPLARALEKISKGSEGRESNVDDSVSALCILNTDRSTLQQLFSTHPPTEKRIEKLRS